MRALTRELIPTEQQEHLAFMSWIQTQPHIRDDIIHIANEGKRSVYYGKKLKSMGLRAGVCDFFLPVSSTNGEYPGLWIELKRTKYYKIDPKQTEWIERMRYRGYKAEFAFGWFHAKSIIDDYFKDAS